MSPSEQIRVRFCPSPTGLPHVGLIRTALFNWAYARHVGGTFIFRIEDTDTARDSEESYHMLLDALRWLGIDWDEGVEVGGPYGPYRQSERLDIYRDVASRLLESGYAYESFSTPEEVEARHKAAGRDPKLGYDGFDRTLSDEQKAQYRAEGRDPVIRYKMPETDIVFDDLVRGTVTFKAGSIPDFVMVRGNGDPLYTLTNPVDDAMMNVTHVLRGEDLLSSTPRQVALYTALIDLGIAVDTPVFGHLPYVMGEGNKKLSKRDPASDLFLHRERGFLPEGMLNYLALLGWGFSADRDIFSVQEMIERFDIKDVNPNPARFDTKKAEAINAEHIRMLEADDFESRLVPYLHAAGVVTAPNREGLGEREREILHESAPLIQTRITLLGEAVGMLGFLFQSANEVIVEEDALKTLTPEAVEILDTTISTIEKLDDRSFSAEAIEAALRAVLIEDKGLKPRIAFTPARVAVTGRRVSPPLFESMVILGKGESLTRLERLREQLIEK